MTPPTKRIRRDPQTAARLILDEAERIMFEQGYAAVSSRRIGKNIGINGATVHYYFPTTDDLFFALYERTVVRQQAELERVIAAADPLAAWWELQSTWQHATLGVELLALCNHRKSLAMRIAEHANVVRGAPFAALIEAVAGEGRLPPGYNAGAVLAVLTAVGRLLVNEERAGITTGHCEIRKLVAQALAHQNAA